MAEPFKAARLTLKSHAIGLHVVEIEGRSAADVKPGRVGLLIIRLDNELAGFMVGDWDRDDDALMLAYALRFLGTRGHDLYAV